MMYESDCGPYLLRLPLDFDVWTPVPLTGMQVYVRNSADVWVVRHMRGDKVLTECYIPIYAPRAMTIPQPDTSYIYEQIMIVWRQPDPWTFESKLLPMACYTPTHQE
jgi:hypothetical protein